MPSFFKFGRVFKVSWGEPVGNDGTDISDQESYRNKIFSKIRRFIVIKSMKGHCLCLPVLTYSGRGVTKPGVHAHEHAPLYIEGRRPQLLDEEWDRGLTRKAIAVVPDRRSDELHPVSRLNYAKVYTIEYNVKVCSVGQVSKRSEWDLTQAYNEIHPPLEMRGSPPPPAASSSYSDNYPAVSTSFFDSAFPLPPAALSSYGGNNPAVSTSSFNSAFHLPHAALRSYGGNNPAVSTSSFDSAFPLPPAALSSYGGNNPAVSTNSSYPGPPPEPYYTPDASSQLYSQQDDRSRSFSADYPQQSSEVYSGYTAQSQYSQPYTSPPQVYADEIIIREPRKRRPNIFDQRPDIFDRRRR